VKSRVTAEDHPNFDLAFTRGYIQSQAYADRFKDNLKFRPDGNSIDYDTAEFKAKYEWLGGGARELIFDFLDDCVADANCNLDVLAYDLDEPDILRRLVTIGRQGRLRAFLDDAPLHTGDAREVQARALLEEASPGNIKVGHLGRFQHHKVLVKRKNGQAVKALAGSANFSVRGLYVQANNVLVYRDPDVAGRFGGVFEALFGAAKGRSKSAFLQSPLSRKWFPADGDGKPNGDVSFAPHADSQVSLKEVADAIDGAQSSVLFAIMGLTGGGPVLDAVRGFASEDRIITYGVTQSAESGSIGLYKPGSKTGITVPFATLSRFVPAPFRKEFDGGKG